MKAGFRVTAMLFSLLLAGCATRQPLPVAGPVDLGRYAGVWYEIAKYPNWFQRACASDTTATYSVREDGRIGVVNRCVRANGSVIEVRGTASVVPDSGNAKLRVRFAWSPVAGDYWILGLDERNYAWALVGHPSRNYLWILSRTPRMSSDTYREIVALAERLGFDSARIELTPQSVGAKESL
jgi:apolipoprotein D and lipocalin family protein